MIGIDRESTFENHLRGLISREIIVENNELYLLDSKDVVDIIICRNGLRPALFFIEVKYQLESSGRWGIGGELGSGFQPEILIERPAYFESNLRWVMGSEKNDNYYFVDNTTVLDYAQGGAIGRKYNGIRKEFLNEVTPLNVSQLIQNIKAWIN